MHDDILQALLRVKDKPGVQPDAPRAHRAAPPSCLHVPQRPPGRMDSHDPLPLSCAGQDLLLHFSYLLLRYRRVCAGPLRLLQMPAHPPLLFIQEPLDPLRRRPDRSRHQHLPLFRAHIQIDILYPSIFYIYLDPMNVKSCIFHSTRPASPPLSSGLPCHRCKCRSLPPPHLRAGYRP